SLVAEHMDTEPEQLQAVLAVEPACRIVVVPGGDLGDQAYLVRSGSCSAVIPRHGQSPLMSYESPQRIGSLPGRLFSRFSVCRVVPEKEPGRANRSVPWPRR